MPEVIHDDGSGLPPEDTTTKTVVEQPKPVPELEEPPQVIVTDEPPPPRQPQRKASKFDDDDDDDDFTPRVRKRVDKLTWRAKTAEEQRDEALQQVAELNRRVVQFEAQSLINTEQSVASEEARIASELASVKVEYDKAYSSGDSDKMFEMSEKLSDLKVSQRQIQSAKQMIEQQKAQLTQRLSQPIDTPRPPSAEQTDAQEKAQEWAKTQEWWGKDRVLTRVALEIDQELRAEGKKDNTDEYYEELESRMADLFPHKFTRGQKQPQRGGSSPIVAGVSRRPSSGTSVRLSREELDMATKLGVSPSEYARYKRQA